MSRKRAYAGLLAVLMVLQMALVGCGSKESSVNDGAKIKSKAYANDGLLGTTGGYPNFPTNPSFHTYAMDKSQVIKALSPIKGIRNKRVTFRGPELIVNLDLEPNVDIEQAMQIKYAALGAVSQMMPRYNVKVVVGKNKL